MVKRRDNLSKTIAFIVLALIILIALSFIVGRYPVSFQNGWTDELTVVFMNIRLPRIILALLVGGALSLSGATFQGVFNNPMAAPDILGATNGAAFGAALAILLNLPSAFITLFAFVFSLLSIYLVFFIAKKAIGREVTNLILAGIVVGSLFSSGVGYAKLVADTQNQLPAITYWMLGSLSGAKNNMVLKTLIPMFTGFVLLWIERYKMNLLTLSDEEAESMGINVKRSRLIAIIGATVLTASSVAVSGMIGWVGLVIPHVSRKLVGSDFRILFPVSFLVGSGFLLLVDDISRCLLVTEIPLGILTSLIGAPFFIYLMIRKGKMR